MRVLIPLLFVVFLISSQVLAQGLPEAPPTPEASAPATAADGLLDLRKDPSLLKLTAHEPLYFLFGKPNAKVQLSVKNQLYDNKEFYIAFTQSMLWDVGTESSPFSDVNYHPELFYRLRDSRFKNAWLDFGAFEHKSNGRGDLESRGWNSAYLRYRNAWSTGHLRFETTFKLSYLYALDENNSDLRRYMGIFESEFGLSVYDILIPHLQLYAKINPGMTFDKGSQEIGLRMKFDKTRSWPYLYIQYFNGYNESLLNYNRSQSSIRVGILR